MPSRVSGRTSLLHSSGSDVCCAIAAAAVLVPARPRRPHGHEMGFRLRHRRGAVRGARRSVAGAGPMRGRVAGCAGGWAPGTGVVLCACRARVGPRRPGAAGDCARGRRERRFPGHILGRHSLAEYGGIAQCAHERRRVGRIPRLALRGLQSRVVPLDRSDLGACFLGRRHRGTGCLQRSAVLRRTGGELDSFHLEWRDARTRANRRRAGLGSRGDTNGRFTRWWLERARNKQDRPLERQHLGHRSAEISTTRSARSWSCPTGTSSRAERSR